jgi:hypothetical protein
MPDLGLAEAIEAVRGELRRAQQSRTDGDVRFTVGPVEIEFVVDVEKTNGVEASVKVLSLLSLGGKGGVTRGETNRVTVTLTPVTDTGEPFEVAAKSGKRPDRSDAAVG